MRYRITSVTGQVLWEDAACDAEDALDLMAADLGYSDYDDMIGRTGSAADDVVEAVEPPPEG